MTDANNFALHPIRGKTLRLGGTAGTLARNISQRWLTDLRETNPAILDMFRDAGRTPYRNLLAWSGEFAGKHLTGAVQLYRLTGDEALFAALKAFVAELLRYQLPNGYLGPFPPEQQLTGSSAPMGYCFDKEAPVQTIDTWDSWGHYHLMYGLLHWYHLTGDQAAFAAVERMAGLFLARFYGPGQPRLVETRSEEMNLSVLHTFAILYQITGKQEYLDFALRVLDDFTLPPAGDYLRLALSGEEFYRMPKPRWESLHPIQGILELYAATGEDTYRQAFEHLWWSMTATDLHNTGGFSTQEQAVGDPYAEGPIETCCTVAYMAVTVDMLRLTGRSTVADLLELSTFNSGMGSFSPSGRWSTYDTPMEGYKRANYHSINFQCRPGSPDLNCCSVNAPRALGMIDDWGFMASDGAITVNYYGPCSVSIPVAGETFTLVQETNYPYDHTIRLRICDAPAGEVTLRLRIPFWSGKNTLTLNDHALPAPAAGGYVSVTRPFQAGDELLLTLDFSIRVWVGEKRLAQRGSFFRGPLCLCADPFYDPAMDIEHLPVIQPETIRLTGIQPAPRGGYLFTFRHSGGEVTLCDLFSAGVAGTPYTTWLPIPELPPLPFTRENPFRLRLCSPREDAG